MTASYLHGVETIEIDDGTRTIKSVKTAVIGVIGTAPIQTVKTDYQTINKPVIITDDRSGAKYFGADTSGYTIPKALKGIFDQGAGIVVVINVFNPATHLNGTTPDPTKVGASDIIGATGTDGVRTGLQAFKDCFSLFGYSPKILIAPGFSTLNTVRTELETIAEKLKAITLIDAPIGTKYADAISGRGTNGTINFATSSDRSYLLYPHLKVYDSASGSNVLEPYSSRMAGIVAAKDVEKGYWFSPSNTVIKGIVGTEFDLTASINDSTCEVNQLNEAGITTVFNAFGTGFRTFGNRSALFPSESGIKTFISSRRTADVIQESIEQAMLPFLDQPLTNGLIDAVCESVNSFLRTLKGRGAIVDGNCWFDKNLNSDEEMANGHSVWSYDFCQTPNNERMTFEAHINTKYLSELTGSSD